MRVLFATDGSAPAIQGERLITSLFDPVKSQIDTYSVTAEGVYAAAPMHLTFELERLQLPIHDAGAVASEASQRLSEAGFAVSSGSGRGDPASEILSKLEEGGHDLVVLGASQTTWVGQLLLGSVSTQVVHHAPCSVLVAHQAPDGSGRILIGVDGSEVASRALHVAMKVLDPSRCAITVISVVSEPWVSVAVYPPGPPFGSYEEYRGAEKETIEKASRFTEHACTSLQDAGFKAEGRVLRGKAGPRLLKEADSIGAELVVVGARGLGPVRRALLGSVSDQVVRHAPATLVGRNPV